MPTITGLRPLDVEFKVSGKKELISETDLKGVITFANEDFAELSGHSIEKLVGSPHNIIRHIDMPQTVFKLLWDNLKVGREYKAVVQNKRSDGKYYWVYSEYFPLYDDKRNLVGYRSKRYPVAKKIVADVAVIYKKLLDLEETKSLRDAEMFLELKLDADGFHSYKEFIEHLYDTRFKGFTGFFRKLFGK